MTPEQEQKLRELLNGHFREPYTKYIMELIPQIQQILSEKQNNKAIADKIRLISIQSPNQDVSSVEFGNWFAEKVEKYLDTILSENTEKWIDVSERLPEFDADVLVFDQWKTREGEERKDIRLSSLTSTTNRKTSNGISVDCEWSGEFNFNITHWQPLPQSPKEG